MTGKSFQWRAYTMVLAALLGSQVSTATEVEGQLVGAASCFRPFHRGPICYPFPSVTIEPSEEDLGIMAPGEGLAESPADVGAVAPSSIMAGGLGAAGAPGAVTPNMIGDFFGGGMAFFPSFGSAVQEETLALAGGDRRFKIVESNRPIPTDRLFFNYHHFRNALLVVDGTERSLDRYTFGVEKTFFDGMTSLELRVPFAGGLDSEQAVGFRTTPAGGNEFGNVALAVKAIMQKRERWLWSAGLAIVFPTGDDYRVFDTEEVLQLRFSMENEAVHLQPFLGLLWEPNRCFFFQFFTQFDFDAGGNTVRMFDSGGVIDTQRRLFDQNLWFVDVAAGRWIYRNENARFVQGIAPVVELHYSTTMQDPGRVSGSAGTVTDFAGRRDVLNLTGGIHFQMGARSDLTVAAVAPLKTDGDRQFDSEISIQFNRRF